VFLRWLLNDVAATSLFDKDGLQVTSAIIDGDVDLDSSNILHDLTFNDCLFTDGIHFQYATVRNVHIFNSTVNGNVLLENATIHADITLIPQFKILGYLSLYGAKISGDLEMVGAQLLRQKVDNKRPTLSLDEAEIKGDVYLTDFTCEGPITILFATMRGLNADGATFRSTVMMAGSTIEGNLSLYKAKATFAGPLPDDTTPSAIDFDRISVSGSVTLSGAHLQCKPTSFSLRDSTVKGNVDATDNFKADGNVDISGSVIKQNFYVHNAKLVELDTSRAQIGTLSVILTEIKKLQSTGAQIGEFGWAGIIKPHEASLNLARSRVQTFRDEQNSWPLSGNLKIIGLVYDDIEIEVPKDRAAKNTAKDLGASWQDLNW
jgi:hypothetical protein